MASVLIDMLMIQAVVFAAPLAMPVPGPQVAATRVIEPMNIGDFT